MSIDPNVVVCVIAVCAIISPIAVALINNRHQQEMRKLDLSREREREVLSHLAFFAYEVVPVKHSIARIVIPAT